jgi:heme/copper-type cytochrome/quinol oxidase subunit 2
MLIIGFVIGFVFGFLVVSAWKFVTRARKA